MAPVSVISRSISSAEPNWKLEVTPSFEESARITWYLDLSSIIALTAGSGDVADVRPYSAERPVQPRKHFAAVTFSMELMAPTPVSEVRGGLISPPVSMSETLGRTLSKSMALPIFVMQVTS